MKRTIVGAALFFAVAAPAHAGTLVNNNGALTYTAGGNGPVSVSILDFQGGVAVYIRGSENTEPPIGCERTVPDRENYLCIGVSSAVVNTGGGNDFIGVGVPAIINAGAGDDTISPTKGSVVSGGPGIDVIPLEPRGRSGSFSLDGVADDGFAGAAPFNVLPDVEDLSRSDAACFMRECEQAEPDSSALTLIGNDAGNTLAGAAGNDTLVGGGGSDRLTGGVGDDTIHARDGVADLINCGPGTDTAIVDQFDEVPTTCENVQGETVGFGLEDKPPTIAWAGASAFAVTAGDDHGVAKVELLLDGRTLCTDTAAPYECSFTPTVALVGRHTVVAIATDSIGQTSSVVRSFSVPRYKPTAVTLTVKGRTASGKVTLPAGVPCSGKVQVGTRTATLRKDCTYRVTVKRAKSYVAEYLGTKAIAPRSSKRVRA